MVWNGMYTTRLMLFSAPSCGLGFNTPTTSYGMPLIRPLSPQPKRPENNFSFDSEPSTHRAQLHIFGCIEVSGVHLQVLDLLQCGIAATDLPCVRASFIADWAFVIGLRADPNDLRYIGQDAVNVILRQTDVDPSLISTGLHRGASGGNAHGLHAGVCLEDVDDSG